MTNKTRRIELRTADGKVILVLHLIEETDLEDSKTVQTEKKPEPKKEKPKQANPQEGEPMMTDAQKRYLFRILSERGVEGDAAYQHLKEICQIDSLKEITKLEASRLIEHLLGEKKEARNGVPF